MVVLARGDKLWEDGHTISFGFLTGNNAQRNKVRAAVDEWSWYANVKFREDPSAASADVKIEFNASDGSWSLTGRDCLHDSMGEATMNLGWIDSSSNGLTLNERAVILQEFGHVLGLLLEHKNPAGGGVPKSCENAAIHLYERTQGWDGPMTREQIINVYDSEDLSSFSEVDRTSIMHHPMPRKILGLDHDVEAVQRLSELDKAYMCITYPRPNNTSHEKAETWTFQYALEKAGVKRQAPEVAEKMSQAYMKGHDEAKTGVDATEIREIFSKWCGKTRTAGQRPTW